jgi:DNA-binding CsgD family transcriptional regulator
MRSFLLIFKLVFFAMASAQPDSLFSLKDGEGIRSLEHWNYLQKPDIREKLLPVLEASYRKQQKPFLEHLAWLLRRMAYVEKAAPDRKEVEKRYKEIEAEAHKKGWKDTEGEIWVTLGNFYSGDYKYGKAFEYILRGYYRFEELGFEKHPHLYRYLGLIADMYYQLGDWESALYYLSILNNVPETYRTALPKYHVQNTMGLAYRNLNKFDSSEYFFNASYQSALQIKDSFWMALSMGNLGHNYYLNGEFDKAEPLLEDDFAASWKAGFKESAVNAGLNLAEIYLKKGWLNKAQLLMDTMQAVVMEKRNTRWMRLWFHNQFTLARENGHLALAVSFADSALRYRDIAATNTNAQIITNTRSKVEAEKYLNKISLLESQKQKELVLRNALLAGIVLVAIILLLVINRSRTRQKHAREKASLERKLADEKLETVRAELDQYMLRMKEKSVLLEKFEQELESLKQSGQAKAQDADHSLGELLQSSILTEEEWVHFRELFEKVHPGFLSRLRVKLPDLTPAETRLLVLTKLKLSNKEMGAMLGIGYDAIKKTRQRLRKKIDLPEEGGVDELIGMI